MADIISFELTHVDGVTPDTGASPSFLYYGARSGTGPIAPPAINHIGSGVYVAVVPSVDSGTGVVWTINTGSYPARLTGASAGVTDTLTAFALENSSGALWTGTAPTFTLYADTAGTPRTPPAIVQGSRVGVYAFTPSPADADVGTVYQITAPAGAYPSSLAGNVTGKPPVTFTAAQQSIQVVRLTISSGILLTPTALTPSNYTVTPSDGLVVVPTVTGVNAVSATVLDLTLSTELTSGTYTVQVAANTWNSADTLTANVTSGVTFTGTGVPPVILAAYAISPTRVRVLFSKALRHVNAAITSDALNVSDYSVSVVGVIGVTSLTDTFFELTTGAAMSAATTYTLHVQSFRDIPGNPITSITVTMPYGAAPAVTPDPGDVLGNTVLVPAEWRLRRPFPYPALETYRQQMLQSSSGSTFIGSRARCVLFFTQDTDVRGIFVDLFGVVFNTPEPRFVLKRSAFDVFNDVGALLDGLAPQALAELGLAKVPQPYRQLLQSRLTSHDYHAKVSAYAAVVLLAAAVIP